MTPPEHSLPRKLRLPFVAAMAGTCFAILATLHVSIAAFLGAAEGSAIDVWIGRVLGTLAWLAAGACTSSLIDAVLWRGIVATALGRPMPGILRTLSSLCVYLAAVSCAVAFVFESSVGAFLTAMGAGGVVLGLALRGMFEDVFTGIAVNLDRAVGIGDWISLGSRERKLVGRVREIGWRCTQLDTDDGQLLVVPNGLLGREVVTNISRPAEPTRFESQIVLPADVPVERGRRILLGAIRSLQDVTGFVGDHAPAVLVGEPTDEGVPYVLRYWILPWNPLSPATARDRVLSRALDDLALANVPLGRTRQEMHLSRTPTRLSHEDSVDERARLLARVRLFDGLAEAERRRLATSLRHVPLQAGATLFRQGDPGETLFVVAEGAVEVLVAEADGGAARRVATLGAGEFLGEMSLLTGDPRRATVNAVTAGVLYELPRETVVGIIAARPEVAEILSLSLARRRAALESNGRADIDPSTLEHGKRSLLQKMLAIFGGDESA